MRRTEAAFALLGLVAACNKAEPPPPAVPDAAPAPVSDARPPDAGFAIVMGTPTVVIETPDAGKPDARPAAPAPARKRPVAEPPRPEPAPAARLGERAVQSTIRSHYGEVERCYAPVALKDPSIAGQVILQWTIGRDGQPTAVAVVGNTVKDPSVARCLQDRARTWRFPPPEGGMAVIRYPFNLRVE